MFRPCSRWFQQISTDFNRFASNPLSRKQSTYKLNTHTDFLSNLAINSAGLIGSQERTFCSVRCWICCSPIWSDLSQTLFRLSDKLQFYLFLILSIVHDHRLAPITGHSNEALIMRISLWGSLPIGKQSNSKQSNEQSDSKQSSSKKSNRLFQA